MLRLGIVLVALAACRASPPPRAHQAVASLEQLAGEWSGGNTSRTCQRLGPRGEHVGPHGDYCQWPTVVRGKQHSTVGLFRDSILGNIRLVWERTISDSLERKRIVDSLDAALTGQGFIAWECVDAGRHWETTAFKVELMSSPVGKRDTSMHIMAYTSPISVSDAFCPPPPGARVRVAPPRRAS